MYLYENQLICLNYNTIIGTLVGHLILLVFSEIYHMQQCIVKRVLYKQLYSYVIHTTIDAATEELSYNVCVTYNTYCASRYKEKK